MSVVLSVEATVSAPGLSLRPWRVGDAAALAAAHRDPVMRSRLLTSLASEADAVRWIEEQGEGWAGGTRLSFAVLQDDPAGRLVGHIVVKGGGGPVAASGEVGYWTAAEARGRGVAPRALEVVSRWALGPQSVMPVARLDLLHAVDNPASCRVAEKCRYVFRALLPPQPPAFPAEGHLHVRTDGGD
ncbi:GNAT family N-acetyltransferase [Actinomadura harenae]|uniref:N-acetyltransferase n=1 Tax=Actinomadura harenae TaxID=2483351 RepID=A0A3M2LRH4_9ACTN|nr:GNAT family N-acetyltransferase [Actinomadura harenae]RMI38715.1 N-acetyltransferase [Actinomadura harenae]